jgi:hypothetical protein
LTTDAENVQKGGVSQEETTSTTEDTQAVESKEKPFSEAQEAALAKLLEDATKKAKEEGYKTGSREMQGKKDAELARERRAKQTLEDTLAGIDSRLGKETGEIDFTKVKTEASGEAKAKDNQRQAAEDYVKNLNDSLNSYLNALGIDPTDERIDWATDESDFVKGRTRFDTSVAAIINADKQTMQEGFDKRLKALEAKGKTEANSVDTTASQGVVSKSDEKFMQDFAAYKVPISKENLERYEKIKQKYY